MERPRTETTEVPSGPMKPPTATFSRPGWSTSSVTPVATAATATGISTPADGLRPVAVCDDEGLFARVDVRVPAVSRS